jgi:hypothetical protein
LRLFSGEVITVTGRDIHGSSFLILKSVIRFKTWTTPLHILVFIFDLECINLIQSSAAKRLSVPSGFKQCIMQKAKAKHVNITEIAMVALFKSIITLYQQGY